MNMGSTSGTWTRERSAGSWRRASILAGGGEMASTSTLATTDFGDVVVGLGAWWCRLSLGAAGQLWRLLEEFPVLRGRLVALFALGNLDFAFALVSFSFVLVNGCCLWSKYSVWIFGTRVLLGSTVDTWSTGGF